MRVKVGDWPSQSVIMFNCITAPWGKNENVQARTSHRCVTSRWVDAPKWRSQQWCNKEPCVKTIVQTSWTNLSVVYDKIKNIQQSKFQKERRRRGETLEPDNHISDNELTADSSAGEGKSTSQRQGRQVKSTLKEEVRLWNRKGTKVQDTTPHVTLNLTDFSSWIQTQHTESNRQNCEKWNGDMTQKTTHWTKTGRDRLRQSLIMNGTPDWLTDWLTDSRAGRLLQFVRIHHERGNHESESVWFNLQPVKKSFYRLCFSRSLFKAYNKLNTQHLLCPSNVYCCILSVKESLHWGKQVDVTPQWQMRRTHLRTLPLTWRRIREVQ